MSYKFWMVKAIKGGGTSKVHDREHDAIAEARRLAVGNPGAVFAVLEATDAYQTRPAEVVRVELEDAPAHAVQANEDV